MEKILFVLLGFLLFAAFQTNPIKTKESYLTHDKEQTWLFNSSSALVSDDADSGSITFKLKDHKFQFKHNTNSHDLVGDVAEASGTWKIVRSEGLEYLLLLNLDTLYCEFGYDSTSHKRSLTLIKKSKHLEQPSYINTYIEK